MALGKREDKFLEERMKSYNRSQKANVVVGLKRGKGAEIPGCQVKMWDWIDDDSAWKGWGCSF